MAYKTLLLVVLFSLVSLSCKEETIIVSSDDTLVDPNVAPRVSFTYPSLNSEGPYLAWDANYGAPFFEVRFNKFMDVASVKRSLKVTSAARSLAMDSNSVYAYERNTFIVSLHGWYDNFFEVGEVLTLSISQPVTDITGRVIPAGVLGTILPEPSFRVRGMSPRDGTVFSAKANVSLTLRFNARVDSSILPHVTVAPALAAAWEFSADSATLSTLMTISSPDQHYVVAVDAEARDSRGNRIARPYTGHIDAAPFVLTAFNSSDTSNLALYAEIMIHTPYPLMLPFGHAFHFAPSVPGGMSVNVISDGLLLLKPIVEFQPSTAYTIRFDTTLQATGGFHLSKEFTFSFRTAAFQRVANSPSHQSTDVSPSSNLSVHFNGNLNLARIPGAFHIVPPAPGNFSSSYGSSIFFDPTDALAPNTLYTVTVDTTLRSVGGGRLAAPITLSFTTGGS